MSLFNRKPKPPINAHEVTAAARILCVHLEGLTREKVTTAFRSAVRAVHPDMGVFEENAATRIRNAGNARDTLVRWLDELPSDTCSTCRGSGWVRGRFGAVRCPNSQCRS